MTRSEAPRSINTERLLLEATTTAHAEGLYRAIVMSLEELRPWMAWAAQPTVSNSYAYSIESERGWDEARNWTFTIFHGREEAGTISVQRWEPFTESAQIGYWLRSDLTAKGLMKEAARAVVRFAFDELELHRLELHAGVENIASIKVAEAAGFVREGVLRHGAKGAFGHYDAYVFGLLESDPRPKA